MPTISDISIVIRAVTQPFTSALKRAQGMVGGFFGKIASVLTPLLSIFKKVGGAVVSFLLMPFKLLTGIVGKMGAVFAAVAGGGIAILIKKQFDLIDAAAKTSRALKINIEFLEGMKLAGSQLGVSNDKITKSLKKFTRTMGEAKLATGAGATVFRVWGKRIEDFQNMNVEDSFLAIAKELKKIKDPTQQAAIAFQFFGRNGIEMMNIINSNKGAIQEFLKESKRLKGAFNKIDVAKVEAANDEVDKLKIAFGGLTKEISFILAPIIKFFSTKFINVFVAARKKLEDFRETIESNILRAFMMVAPVVIQAGNLIKTVFAKLNNFLQGPDTTGWMQAFTDGLFDILANAEFVALNLPKIMKVAGMGMELAWKEMLRNLSLAFINFAQWWVGLVPRMIKFFVSGMTGASTAIARLVKGISLALADPLNFDKSINNLTKQMTGKGSIADKLKKTSKEFAKTILSGLGGATKAERKKLADEIAKLNAERKKFVEGRRKDADFQTNELATILAGLQDGIGEGLKNNIVDKVEEAAGKINLTPKLALRGSQAAAKIGIADPQRKIADNTKDLVAQGKKSNELLSSMEHAMRDPSFRFSGNDTDGVNVFNPSVIAQATGR